MYAPNQILRFSVSLRDTVPSVSSVSSTSVSSVSVSSVSVSSASVNLLLSHR